MSDAASLPHEREWVVMLRARSTIRLRGDPRVLITASPASTAPVTAIQIRNSYSKVDSRQLVTGLLVEGRGPATTADDAVRVLAGWAAPYLQVIATAANGAVDDPRDVIVHAPPTTNDTGHFVERRACGPLYPATTIRSITADDLMPVLQHLDSHADRERLQRAMAHYRHALAVLDPFPFNRVECAESLFMACENLLQVILRRLYTDAGLPDSGDSKHTLAVMAGFNPVNATSRQHLSDFDSHVRITQIFDGDDDVYKKLKFASDHFEHGSRSFDKVQDAAEFAADRAFGHVRRAILREIGVPDTSPLFTDAKYNEPQAGWQPILQLTGSYTSTRSDEWPYFYGSSPFPEVLDIVDLDDDQRRNVTYKFTATGQGLLDGQTVRPASTLWVTPLRSDRKVESGEPVVEFTPGAPTTAALPEPSPVELSPRPNGLLTRLRRCLASLIGSG